MEKQAWYCPSCKAHHAPHVETCPASREASDVRHDYGGLRGIPFPMYDPCASCIGACGKAACPRRAASVIYGSRTGGLAP